MAKKKSKDKKWIQKSIKRPGRMREWCRRRGYSGVTEACIREAERQGGSIARAARLARTLKRLPKRRRRKS